MRTSVVGLVSRMFVSVRLSVPIYTIRSYIVAAFVALGSDEGFAVSSVS
jgi:hypothetical protein